MFAANILKVVIASPGDVTEERKVVTEEIHRWNDANASARKLVLLPVKWETHTTPQMGAHPQSIINRQLLVDADIVVGIFGTRIGTPTAEYVSGSVEEIKRHVAEGKTAKIYFSDVPVPPSELNTVQYSLVKQFQEECQSTGLYATFNTLHDLARDFGHHLSLELNQPRYRWLISPELEPTEMAEQPLLSHDSLHLLKAVAAEDDGTFIFERTLGGEGLRIGAEEFIDGTARSAARWRAAIETLLAAGTIEVLAEDVYRITARGYEIVDSENQASKSQQSAFEEQKSMHTRQISDALTHSQRDLLRFLLLKGGAAMNDVIHRAWLNQQIAFDWHGLTSVLSEKGLISIIQDRMNSRSTVVLNESMSSDLKKILFPRNEDGNTPAFNGI